MIFNKTLAAVLDGSKTQTTRIVKETEWWIPMATSNVYRSGTMRDVSAVYSGNRLKWKLGGVYAVQPNRGKKAVARIQIVKMRVMYLFEMSEEDAKAEGFNSLAEFSRVWDEINDREGCRWKNKPAVYTINFNLVEDTE